MRQSNGTDILGDNDSRSVTIGIIDVSPDDERENVLAAILTQEKLARQVIVIVLPPQNKAFQRPVDFDGLKNMRRTLKAQLVLIAPQGSGPAEFARQRRFTLFWSLEAYAQSLRTEQQAVPLSKRGWSFGRKGQPQRPANPPAPQVPTPPIPPVMAMPPLSPPDPQPNVAEYSHVVGLPAPVFPIDNTLVSDVEQFPTMTADTAPRTEDVLRSQGMLAYTDEQEDVATQDTQDTQDTTELPGEMLEDEDTTDNAEEEFDPDKTQPRGRNTSQPLVPVSEPQPMILTAHPPRIPHVPHVAHDNRNVQASPSVGTGSTDRTGRASGTGKAVGTRGMFWAQLSTTRRRWLFALLILLLLLLIGGGVYTAFSVFGTEVTATITITPARETLQHTYTISAVTGVANTMQSQVEARFLLFAPPAQSKTVAASGQGTRPATDATGTLTFYNSLSTPQTLPANTLVTDAKGIEVVTDSAITLPAAALPTVGSADVKAHTINTGTVSNIAANDFSNVQCCAADVSVGNAVAFSGGKNPQTYTYVEQSDIDSATSQLSSTLSQSAQTGIMGQILPDERLISRINCVPDITSSHLAGDIAANVTVTVTETCSGEVYNQLQAHTKAEELLRADAMKSPGANYALLGNIITTITQAVLVHLDGKIALLVKAGGVWVYQFSDTQKRQLAQQIVGKSEKDAVAMLAAAHGVGSVNVQVNGGDGNTLPGDSRHIIIVVRS